MLPFLNHISKTCILQYNNSESPDQSKSKVMQ